MRLVLVVGAVAALHVALVWMLQKKTAPRARADVPRTAMVFVEPVAARPITPPAPESVPAKSVGSASGAPKAPAGAVREARVRKSLPIALPRPASPSETAEAWPSPDPSNAVAAPPQRPVLDTRVIQRAVGEVAASSSFEQRALRSGLRSGGDRRLESGMAAAAHGDCLKGDFRGSDMGLLSLPMLALAAAEGKCGAR